MCEFNAKPLKSRLRSIAVEHFIAVDTNVFQVKHSRRSQKSVVCRRSHKNASAKIAAIANALQIEFIVYSTTVVRFEIISFRFS